MSFICSSLKYKKNIIIAFLCILTMGFSTTAYAAGSSKGPENCGIVFPIAINGLGSGVNLKEACVELMSNNSCDFYIKGGVIICQNGARINKAHVSAPNLNDAAINQALSPYGMETNITAEKDTVYIVYSKQGYVGAVLFSSIDKSGDIYEGIGVSTLFDDALEVDDALKQYMANPSESEKIDKNLPAESKEEKRSLGSGEKEIQIVLNGASNGVNLQGGCLESISTHTTDFYINNGTIICLNDAKINGMIALGANSDAVKQALSVNNFREAMEARTDMAYVVISPRGCFGVVMLTSIDKSQNSYKGIAISSSLDNALKQQIIETSPKSNMDTADSVQMDVFKTGEMDVLSSGGYDYFDTEISSAMGSIVYEGKQINFAVPPRRYEDGEVLVLLKDIAPLFGITITSKTESGIEKATITKGLKTFEIEAYSDKAHNGVTEIKLKRAPKMDNKGILVPLSFLSEVYSVHFSGSEDGKILSLSGNPIIEWRYTGYSNEKPYAEYESKFVDGIITKETRSNGKNHVFKNITLYNKSTGETMVIPENKMNLYADKWSTTPPAKNSGDTNTASNLTSPANPFFMNMNMQRFFKSSTFNTWGGQMIRRIVP